VAAAPAYDYITTPSCLQSAGIIGVNSANYPRYGRDNNFNTDTIIVWNAYNGDSYDLEPGLYGFSTGAQDYDNNVNPYYVAHLTLATTIYFIMIYGGVDNEKYRLSFFSPVNTSDLTIWCPIVLYENTEGAGFTGMIQKFD
jgi:hypothetical protein